MDVERALTRGLDFFGDTVRRVDAQDWDQPTPCEEWNARQLTGHVLAVVDLALRMLRGENLGAPVGGADVDDPVREWDGTATALRRELAGADLETERETVLGSRSLAFSLTFPAVDLYMHAWDLGRATGQEVEIPEDVVAWIDGFLRQLPTERMRSPRAFGPEQPAPPGADPTTRLMAFTGRRVS